MTEEELELEIARINAEADKIGQSNRTKDNTTTVFDADRQAEIQAVMAEIQQAKQQNG